MASSPDPAARRPGKTREATRLESLEEIRQVLQARGVLTPKEIVPEQDTVPFRPFRRPPTPLLCILDDNGDEGEWIRLRGDGLVIGRSEGDILFPNDSMISGRHAELA